jgi:hypothetical protein
MGWLNGKDHSAQGTVSPVPPAAEPEKALVVPYQQGNVTTTELTRFMPVMDIQQAVQRRDAIVKAMQLLMKEGVDYGKIDDKAGSRPALLQPGADKLCNLFGLVVRYRFLEKVEDWDGKEHGAEPFFYYQIATEVYRGEFLMGEGVGSCCSRESKYRYRKAERACPQCGRENIRKSRDTGWYCWAKTGGCGATFSDGDPSIEGQQAGRKLNPDICDSVNTILKIAYKRAKVSGTINATSAAEFFTQDVEDFSVSDDHIDTGGHPPNTRAAALHVAEQKLATGNVSTKAPWKNMKELAQAFEAIREAAGEVAYRSELERYGWRSFQEMRNAIDNKAPNAKEKAVEAYWHLDAVAHKGVA